MQSEIKPIDTITRDVNDAYALQRASEKMMIFEGDSDGEWYVWFVLAKDQTEARKRLYDDYNAHFRTFGQFCAAMFNKDAPRIRYIGRGYIRLSNGFPFRKSQFITRINDFVIRIGGTV